MSQESPNPASKQRPPMPGWVKAFVIAGFVLVALAGIMMATGHGPGRHFGTTLDDPK